jgi:PAS domain-containing protein
MNANLNVPILLVSNSSSARLLDFLNIRAKQLQHTTSLRTAFSVLENYPAKIIICDLPINESIKLVQSVNSQKVKTIVFLPSFTTIKDIEGLQATVWLTHPFDNDLLDATLENIQNQILEFKILNDKSHLAEQLQHAFESSAIVSKTNPQGIITYANQSFEEISGYTKEELIGKPHNIVRHPDMPKSVFAQM